MSLHYLTQHLRHLTKYPRNAFLMQDFSIIIMKRVQKIRLKDRIARITRLEVPSWLSGFVCAFQPAAPGSSPKHTNLCFHQFIFELCQEKKTEIKKHKEAGIWPNFLKKESQDQQVHVLGAWPFESNKNVFSICSDNLQYKCTIVPSPPHPNTCSLADWGVSLSMKKKFKARVAPCLVLASTSWIKQTACLEDVCLEFFCLVILGKVSFTKWAIPSLFFVRSTILIYTK